MKKGLTNWKNNMKMSTKLFLAIAGIFLISHVSMAQIQTGVWRTPSGNTDYHHFVRNGVGPAVYINQESTIASHAILRLSSGSGDANQNVKFTVENNGNVGIGTMAPTGRLNVNGSTTIGGKWNPSASFLTITQGPNMLIMDHNEMYSNAMIAIGSTSGDIVDFRRVTGTGFQSFMQLKQDGKLGIGISNPTGKVEIRHLGTIGGKWDPSKSFFTISDGGSSLIMDSNEINSSGSMYLGSQGGDFYFRTISTSATNERVVIKSNGDVGIGTTTPDSKLSVNGNIRAHEIKLETSNWPDYVFEEGYQLSSLKEVNDFIQKNGHLPDLEKAEVYETEGVDMMKLNLQLLKKIEELTLYQLQLLERIEQLENKMDTK